MLNPKDCRPEHREGYGQSSILIVQSSKRSSRSCHSSVVEASQPYCHDEEQRNKTTHPNQHQRRLQTVQRPPNFKILIL